MSVPVHAGVQAVEAVQVVVEAAQQGPPVNIGEQQMSVPVQAGLQSVEVIQVVVSAAQQGLYQSQHLSVPVQAGVQAVEVVQVAVEGAQEGGPPANVGEQHLVRSAL